MYNSIAKKIGSALKDAYNVSTDVTLGPPEDPMHGDLTTNIAMQVSKEIGKSPREIAETLISSIEDIEDIERVEIAGPGFINITLTIAARLKLLLRAKAYCSPQEIRKDEAPVIVEYSHPNIAKPLGVHHILSTVIGQAIANLHRHLGYNTISWNYIGDWGTQFGKLAVAMEKWGEDKPTKDYTLDELLDLYVRFHEEAEKESELEDLARKAFRRLELGETELRKFWEAVTEISFKSLNELYDRLHVSFDITKGESPY